MSQSQGTSRKKTSFKGPDAFQARVMEAIVWVKAHPRQVMTVVIPLLGFGLVLSLGGVWVNYQTTSRQALLSKIDDMYDREERDLQERRRAVLDKKEHLLNPLDDKANKADEAELKALEEEVEAMKADHTKSLAEYESFLAKHSDSAESLKASMSVARVLLDQKEYEKAKNYLQKSLASKNVNDYYGFHARVLLVSVLEEVSDYDTALAEATKLVELSGDDDKAFSLWIKARVLMLAGKKDECAEILRKIINDHNSSDEARDAKGLLSVLGLSTVAQTTEGQPK